MRPFLFALTAVICSTTAEAQAVKNGETFGAWTVNCSAVAVGKTACVLAQRVLRSDDRAFIAEILAFQSEDGSKSYLSARVPIGVYLPAGFAIRAEDSDEVVNFAWQTCGRDLCEAVVQIDPQTLADMAVDDLSVLAAFKPNLQAENFVFRFSMDGVVEGLAALKPIGE